MEAIYRMNIDCGRMGELEGVFTATKEQIKKLTDGTISVYWGEVLGKHSEVYGAIEPDEIIMISDDPNTVDVFNKNGFASGYNPFYKDVCDFDYEGNGINEDLTNVEEIIEELIKK